MKTETSSLSLLTLFSVSQSTCKSKTVTLKDEDREDNSGTNFYLRKRDISDFSGSDLQSRQFTSVPPKSDRQLKTGVK